MIKITEQGEVLSYKYAVPQSASYELELAISGLIKASKHLVIDDTVCTNNFEEIMSEMSIVGEKNTEILQMIKKVSWIISMKLLQFKNWPS